MLPNRWLLLLLLLPLLLPAQETSDLKLILQRLEQLERENRNLADEVHALRAEIAGARPLNPLTETPGTVINASPAPIDERASVLEQRTEELSQTKVEAARRMPVTLTGMLLFNAFL